jgi:hypothetical protein
MGDIDQGHGAFANVLSVEISDTVLGNHIVNIAPSRHHTGAWFEERHDTANCVIAGG